MKAFRQFLFVLFLVAPSLTVATWSAWPSLQAVFASRRYTPLRLSEQDWQDSGKTTELRRQVQRHFLSYNVYIPLEDIVVTTNAKADAPDLSLLMQKACGRGRLFVWIPLKFRVPITGEKVFEWCWKPQANS